MGLVVVGERSVRGASGRANETFGLTVSWANAPPGGEYICIGRSEANVPYENGFPVATIKQGDNCTTMGATNGSGTVTMEVGANLVGTAVYNLFEFTARAQGSFQFTINVTP